MQERSLKELLRGLMLARTYADTMPSGQAMSNQLLPSPGLRDLTSYESTAERSGDELGVCCRANGTGCPESHAIRHQTSTSGAYVREMCLDHVRHLYSTQLPPRSKKRGTAPGPERRLSAFRRAVRGIRERSRMCTRGRDRTGSSWLCSLTWRMSCAWWPRLAPSSKLQMRTLPAAEAKHVLSVAYEIRMSAGCHPGVREQPSTSRR